MDGSAEASRRSLLASESSHRRESQAFEDVVQNDAINDALGMLAKEYLWSWLKTDGSINLNGYYTTDSFRTFNQFNGGELGLVERWWKDRWSLQVLGKAAIGATQIGTGIGGSTTTTKIEPIGGVDVETPVTSVGSGVLAQPTNAGNTKAYFAGIGELGITADYALFSQFRVNVGYSLIYWTTVARVGDQVDPSVNPTQFGGNPLVGPAAPTLNLSTTGFWAQGVNVGFEYQF